MTSRPAELHLAWTAPAADRLWEELGAISVSESGGKLVAGFPSRADAEAAAALVGGVVVELDPHSNSYLDAWRKWAKPFHTGRLCVRPEWLAPLGAPVEVAIDPGHAFGHGSHASTSLVLTALERRVAAGDRVLDVGCGSGVLAIAALALGAASATALDIDPVALTMTASNALANGVSRRLTVSGAALGTVREEFDIVVANIGVTVLRELAPVAAARVGVGGWLMFSGLLEHQWQEIVATVHGFELDAVATQDGWSAPILCRRAQLA